MKKPYVFILLLLLASVTMIQAQQTPSPSPVVKHFDKVLSQVNTIDVANKPAVKKLASTYLKGVDEDLLTVGLGALKADIERVKKEIEYKKNEYIPSPGKHSSLLDKDFMALIADMPEPVTSLPAARQTMRVQDEQNIFTRYIETLKQKQENLQEEIRQHAAAALPSAGQAKNNAMKNAKFAQQDLNNSAMIQEMGGIDKLQAMTPAQRAALGKQMAGKMKQNPSAYNGQESDPKKAFAKKMMTDTGYAERFKYMNKSQQEEEYEAFKKENGFIDNPVPSKNEAAEKKKASLLIDIQKRTSEILEHRKALAGIASGLQQQADEYFDGVYKKLDDALAKRVKALPQVEHGEAGKSAETRPVDIAYNITLLPIKAQQALTNKYIWVRYVETLKITVAEYEEFLGEFWGKDAETDRILTQYNQTPTSIIAGLCGELSALTKMAKNFTAMNASAQRSYDEKVLQVYE